MEFAEKELDAYRRKLAPLIGRRVITGYNVYARAIDSTAPFQVNYLHANLAEDDEHRLKLLDKISNFGLAHTIVSFANQVVSRQTLYRWLQLWKDQTTLRGRFYDFEGNEIPYEKLDEYDSLIHEDMQYDMLTKCEQRSELEAILECFDRYANKFTLDPRGSILRIRSNALLNPDRIITEPETTAAVPVVIVKAENFSHPKYVASTKFYLRKGASEIGTFIANSRLQEFLISTDINWSESGRHINRVFAEFIEEESCVA